MEKTYKHLLFDLDRTLWDFESNSYVTLREVYRLYNIASYCDDYDVFYHRYRKINEGLWLKYHKGEISKNVLVDQRFTQTFAYFGFNDEKVGIEAGKYYLDRSPKQTILFPGAKEALEYLSTKYTIHIVTNGFSHVQADKIKSCEIDKYVSLLISSEEIGYQKPDSRIFSYFLQKAGAKAGECIMIGDDEKNDILGGINSGIDSIWFNPDKNKSELNLPILAEIESLYELKDIL